MQGGGIHSICPERCRYDLYPNNEVVYSINLCIYLINGEDLVISLSCHCVIVNYIAAGDMVDGLQLYFWH